MISPYSEKSMSFKEIVRVLFVKHLEKPSRNAYLMSIYVYQIGSDSMIIVEKHIHMCDEVLENFHDL